MNRSILLGTLTAFASTTLPACAQVQNNLIANSSFDLDADGNGTPDGWDRVNASRSWEKEAENRFYRLKALEPDKITSLYKRVPLPQGARALELSWKQRVSDLKIGQLNYYDARIIVNFKDAAGETLKGSPPPAYTNKNSADWTSRSIKFLVPEGAVNVDLMPALFKVQAGTFDLDDVTLTVTNSTELEAVAAAKIQKEKEALAQRQAVALQNSGPNGELLVNGDFQQATKVDTQPDGWPRPEASGQWVVEEGNRYLRLTASEPHKIFKYHRTVDIPANVGALQFQWKQRVSGLQIGKLQHYDARMVMNFKHADGRVISGVSPVYTQKDTKGWIEKSTSFLVPDDVISLEFMPMLFNTRAGTFELDDLSLKPIDAAPLRALQAKREAQQKFNNVAPEAPNKAKWPLTLRVVGTKVLDAADKEVLLRGVNVPSLGWKPVGKNVLRSIMVAIDDWKSNVIRLPVKETMWFGMHPDQKDSGVAYRKLVDDAITMAANRGAYVVLDLHSFRAPKQLHADFWKEAAAKYKDHPAVIFDVFNEPYSISWKVWRDGGLVEDKNGTYSGPDEVSFLNDEEKQVRGFRSIGMQAMIDAIRGTGAKNIVIVGGLDYAYDLSGLANGYTVDERGGNGMMLSTHIYAQKRDYPGKVLIMADKYPIFVGEFGAVNKKFDFMPATAQEDAVTWVPKIFGFMQKHGMHYTGWSFHPGAGPVMLQDWDYTPTTEWGGVAKRALAGEKFPYAGMR